jgi:putative redox protein
MADFLEVDVELINDKMKFSCRAGDNPPVIADYIPPLGDKEGYMPLELFLISLASCLGGTVAPLLRRMKKNLSKLSVRAKGLRKTEHPTGFSKIILDISIVSDDVTNDDVEKAVRMSSSTFCPVLSMLKKDIEIEINHAIK